MKSAKYAGYVAITAGSELKGKHLMKHANIRDIPTYLRLCSRQHKRKYVAMESISFGNGIAFSSRFFGSTEERGGEREFQTAAGRRAGAITSL